LPRAAATLELFAGGAERCFLVDATAVRTERGNERRIVKCNYARVCRVFPEGAG